MCVCVCAVDLLAQVVRIKGGSIGVLRTLDMWEKIFRFGAFTRKILITLRI
jgi:hypothetical protein